VRVAVVGATGVLGRAVVPVLVRAGHDVVGLASTSQRAALLTGMGAEASAVDTVGDGELVGLVDGADAVCNLAGHVPTGLATLRPGAWRADDRLRTDGVRRVVAAARAAGVRRVVQGSASYLYADQGDGWVGEESPLAITRATEPASVGELHVQDYACGSRTAVVLRLGTVVGHDTPRAVRRAVGLGAPASWAHVIHVDDLGPAVLAALAVPGGVYNVGAEPVRRADLLAGAAAAGRGALDVSGPLLRRLGGERLEPLTRSLRVSSERFAAHAGWQPSRARFDASWFGPAAPTSALR
jgi:nucleoside-diphosphate-sugar epimerase